MMVHCYKHVIESTEFVRQLIGGSSDSSFQLNERQCHILVEELVETSSFLEKRSASSKFGEGVGSISLRHLCSAVKRVEVLVKKCCCKDLESWLVSAMMLVEIQEEFMAIILDIHLWRMLLDFAITCGMGLSLEKKAEEMKIMDEEYHQLFKDLRRESHALRQAAVEDKGTIISRISRIANLRGSTNGMDYLRAIYLQSWLTGSAACRNMDLEKCEYLHLLGQGASGAVMKVKWLGVECALKMLVGQDEKEATALKGLFHPNIIRLFHYWEDHPENPQSRLLMELMPKDLGAYIKGLLKGMSSLKLQMGKDSMPFSLPVAIDIMYQIAQAMRYMHEKHLTHRDLKPANILVKERPRVGLSCTDGIGYLDVKLADFGLVKSYTNTSTFQAHSRNKGTGMYRAPEILGKDMTQKRHYLPMADVWSFGITCAEILSGEEAYVEYVDNYGSALQTMICKEGLRPTLPKHCPQYLAFCIKSCWEFLPSRRPTFASLCKLLRHAKLLSLGVMKLDDSKFFFAYTTRSDQVQSLNLSRSSSRARVSTFFQSSLKFMACRVPSVAEVLPAAAVMHEVRLVPTPLITEDNPELDEDIGGGIATPGSLVDGKCHYSAVLPIADILQEERVASTPMVAEESPLADEVIDGECHYSAVLPIADILHEERVVSTPMVTEESPLADEVIAGSIATLANPTQRVKSLPDLQEPTGLTQASLDTAISPPDASDPIQPAIIPRKKLERILLTKKADAGKFAKDCEAEQEVVATSSGNPSPWNLAEICENKEEKEEAVTSSGNLLKKHSHSRQKNQSPGRLLSHIQDFSEGKSPEPDLCKFRRAASASIILPKPPPPAYLEGLNDGSPRLLIRNNGSRAADGYQIRDPPPGSHQDDVVGRSPKNLWMAVMEVKSAVIEFAEVLITNMNKHPGELEYLKQTILREVRADMDIANHWKFLVQAFICKRLFDGFDSPNGYSGIDDFKMDRKSTNVSFADFFLFINREATISMLLDSDLPDGSFIGRFCFKKFKSISGDLTINQPLPIYQEEWSAVQRERHPKTVFYQSFLKVAVSVWLVHRWMHSSKEKVEMLIYEKGAKFQRQTMESVVPGSYEEEDEETDVNTEVGFSVIPGFQMCKTVVKCEVYLCSRNRHTDVAVTGETLTDTSPGKTLSAKTSEVAVTCSRNLTEIYETKDDDTGPSPKNLLKAVMEVKIAVIDFAEVLTTNMNSRWVKLKYLRETILQEVRADIDRGDHWKFLVQAFICRRLFDGFDAPNRYFGVEYFENDQMTKLISFADFSKFMDKPSTISMLLDSNSPDGSFLGRFCFKKFKSIIGELVSNQPSPIYQEELDAIERERHPKTVFYQSFLKVAVSVWLVHRLVHSFEEKVEMLIYEKGAKFQRQTMESVVPGSCEGEDKEADVNTEVGFSVIPGFQVGRSVVKCEVYLRSRNRHTDMEITGETSTEKTPVKTPVKCALKSFSGKTSVKLHTPSATATALGACSPLKASTALHST